MYAAVVVQPEVLRMGVESEVRVLTRDRAIDFGSIDECDLVHANQAGAGIANLNPSPQIDSFARELVDRLFGRTSNNCQLDAGRCGRMFRLEFGFASDAREGERELRIGPGFLRTWQVAEMDSQVWT
jgi:hypothetical protein